jgi:hypothetical protein
MRLPALLATALLLPWSGPAPAQAQDTGTFGCHAVVNLAAGSGNTTCTGHITSVTGSATGSLSVQVFYNEVGCPLLGTAAGQIFVNGSFYADVEYIRWGVVFMAIYTGPHVGTAAGYAFMTDPGQALCTGSADVRVTGVFAGV